MVWDSTGKNFMALAVASESWALSTLAGSGLELCESLSAWSSQSQTLARYTRGFHVEGTPRIPVCQHHSGCEPGSRSPATLRRRMGLCESVHLKCI